MDFKYYHRWQARQICGSLSFWQMWKIQPALKNIRNNSFFKFILPPTFSNSLLPLWHVIYFLFVGNRCRPQLQPHISNQKWRFGPGRLSDLPYQPNYWGAFRPEAPWLWKPDRPWSPVHVHSRSLGHGGNHASWTSLCYRQNYSGFGNICSLPSLPSKFKRDRAVDQMFTLTYKNTPFTLFACVCVELPL